MKGLDTLKILTATNRDDAIRRCKKHDFSDYEIYEGISSEDKWKMIKESRIIDFFITVDSSDFLAVICIYSRQNRYCLSSTLIMFTGLPSESIPVKVCFMVLPSLLTTLWYLAACLPSFMMHTHQ